VVDFGTVTKSINARRYIFNNKKIDELTYLAAGSQTALGAINADNIFVEAICNVNLNSQQAGYWTTAKIDTTGYKTLYIEGEFFDTYGDTMLQIQLSSDINYANGVVAGIQGATSNYSRGDFIKGVDITSYQGLYHVNFWVYAAQENAQVKARITKIYLSKTV
jgi:hypothetical protein